MSGTDVVNILLDRAWGGAHSTAQLLEAGQVRCPLTDRFDELGSRLQDSTLRGVVLGLCPESRARALSWLSGKDCGFLAASWLDRQGVIEVVLNTGGISLVNPLGQRQDFSHPAELEAALRLRAEAANESENPGSWVAPTRLVLPCCDDAAGIRLLIPASAGSLTTPGAFSGMGPWLGVLIIAGRIGAELSDLERSSIADLTALAEVCLPVVIPDRAAPADGSSASATSTRRWWDDPEILRSSVVLPALRWAGTGPPPAPRYLLDGSDPIRRVITRAPLVRGLTTNCELLRGHVQEQAARTAKRLAASAQRLRELESSVPEESARADADALRRHLTDRCAALDDVLQWNAQQAGLPDSVLIGAAMEAVGSKADVDFATSSLTSALAAGLADAFDRHLAMLREVVGMLQGELSERLTRLVGRPVALEAPAVSRAALPADILGKIRPDWRWAEARPGEGFLSHLAQRQNALVTTLIVLSIAGAALGLIRSSTALVVLALLGLAATLTSAFISWLQVTAERREQEQDRLREGLVSECERFVQRSQEAALDHLRRLLAHGKQSFLDQMDPLVPEMARARAEVTLEEQKVLGAFITSGERRRRELSLLEDRVTGVISLVRQTETAHAADAEAAIGEGIPRILRRAYAGRD